MSGRDAVERAAAAAASGHRGRLRPGESAQVAAAARDDPDPRVREVALGALVRAAGRRTATSAWRAAAEDPVPAVRRRAAELGPALAPPARPLLALLADSDASVAETAAWALGELRWGPRTCTSVVRALSRAAGDHDDALVREAAVAALGALGDPRGLPAVIAGCRDRPAVRRRAVLALAPFDGPEVEAALQTALTDPDWQVRQAAEDLST